MARTPWRSALDEEERACLLSLLRKMIVADTTLTSATTSTPMGTTSPPSTGGEGAGEVSETPITA
jgi:hypothetical protein